MRAIIRSKSGEKAMLTSDGINAIIEGDALIYDVVHAILSRKELKHSGQIKHFPDSMVGVNSKGVAELNTASFEYLKEYLPDFCKSFDLTVEFIEQ